MRYRSDSLSRTLGITIVAIVAIILAVSAVSYVGERIVTLRTALQAHKG